MRKVILTLFFVCLFSLWATPIHALTVIDAQPMTSCNANGYCKTTIDVSPYLTTKELDDFKISDYTKSLTALTYDKTEVAKPKEATDFTITYNASVMTVSGNVQNGESAYWTLALTKDVLIDPWWNFTTNASYNVTVTSITLSDGGVNADDFSYRGVFITLGNNADKLHIKKHDTSTVPFVRLYNASGTNIANASYVGSWAVFDNVSAGGYYVLNNVTQGTDHMWQATPVAPPYPYTNGSLSVVTASIKRQSGALANYSTYWFEIEKVILENTTEQTFNIWWTANLYLNSNQSNVTFSNDTALNSTAISNLTGSIVSIWINDTLSANDTENVTNITALPAGLYNITAFFGNSTTNETITWWANITLPMLPAGTAIGYVLCVDNTTLGHINVTNLQTDNVITYYENCANGCDNVTTTCNPSPGAQLFYAGLIISFIALLTVLAARRIK